MRPTPGGWVAGGVRLLLTAALSAAAVGGCLAYVAQPFRIQGSSMSPTLESGERVLVNRLGARLGRIGRGDIVVFRDPANASVAIVKRVIAAPGDTVRFLGEDVEVTPGAGERGPFETAVTPVARAAEEDASPFPAAPGSVGLTLAPGEYFVIGDNREASSDSRHRGAIPQGAIIGEAVFRLFPWRRIGPLGR